MHEICQEDSMFSVIAQKFDLETGLRKHFHFRDCLQMPYSLGNNHNYAFPSSKYYDSFLFFNPEILCTFCCKTECVLLKMRSIQTLVAMTFP